jgi:hypothetical protein
MAKIKDMTIEDLEHFIENKFLEIIGDPDSGLQLKREFKTKLQKRLSTPSKRISHQEVLKRFA